MFKFQGTRKPDFKNVSQDIYEDYWAERGFRLRSKLLEREHIFMAWIKAGAKVLSIGCGNSRLLYELRQNKNCEVYGLDVAGSVIQGLQNEKIIAWQADVSEPDFELQNFTDLNFDYIIMSELLEHLVLPEKLVAKVKTKGEALIISIPNSAFYRFRLGLLWGGRFFTQWAKHPAEHLRYWSHIDFLDWLEAQGLRVVKYKASNGPRFLSDLWPNMFGHQICYLAVPQT